MTSPGSVSLTESGLLDRILFGDCLELFGQIPAGSIDLVLADLPYGTTQNKWDSVIDLPTLWEHYRRVVKPNGAIVLTAAQPFTSVLVCSNLKMFKYEWIWSKTVGSGQLNIRHQPLRTHESVLVFYSKVPSYTPQMTEGSPYTQRRDVQGDGYGKQRPVEVVNDGKRHPKSVLTVPNPRTKGGHPTQKPVALFSYLIETYTQPGEVVLDNVIGSGTTAESALRTGRRYVGMELDPAYHTMAVERAERVRSELDSQLPL